MNSILPLDYQLRLNKMPELNTREKLLLFFGSGLIIGHLSILVGIIMLLTMFLLRKV